MYCPKCGAPVNPGDEFCGKCGASLAGEEVQEEKKRRSYLPVIIAIEILFIAVVGGGLFLYVSRQKEEPKTQTAEAGENTKEQKEDKEEPKEATPTPIPEPTATPVPTEIPKAEAVLLLNSKEIERIKAQNQRMTTDKVISSLASSVIKQAAVQNPPINILDGDQVSNWQEGVDGSGIGESVEFQFDKEYQVKGLTLKLGNWKSEKYYYGNNRPKTLTFQMGTQSWEVEFPDAWQEFGLEFTHPVSASNMKITINDVHKGKSWDDTVIADISVWHE